MASLTDDIGHEANVDIGPVISKDSKKRIEKIIEGVAKEGGHVLLDGRGVKVDKYPNGNFVGPTVITGVQVSLCLFLQFGDFVLFKANYDLLQRRNLWSSFNCFDSWYIRWGYKSNQQ